MSHRIIRKFIRVVGNEKCSPVLLPYETEIIAEIETMVKDKSEMIENFKQNMAGLPQIQIKMSQAMELEILRWNYLLQLYHSTRFHKIQSLVGQMKKPASEHLSPIENQFVTNLIEAYDAAMSSSLTENNWYESNGDPNKFVFFKSLKHFHSEQMSSNETSEPIEIPEKTIGFAHFYKVYAHLARGDFQLV